MYEILAYWLVDENLGGWVVNENTNPKCWLMAVKEAWRD